MTEKQIESLYQDKSFHQLEKSLGVSFRSKSSLIQAFVHRSFLNEHPDFPLDNNERLEFLGDAILELLVTEHLFRQYHNTEGELTRWRAALVNTKTLSSVAEKFNFSKYLFLSRGEGSRSVSRSLLADTLEAFIGAAYLDQGMAAVQKFIEQHILILLPGIIESVSYLDAKSELQELIQAGGETSPTYQVLETQGPDHDKQFKVGVFLGQKMISSGTGHSKQAAEQMAAEQALKLLKKS